MPAPASPHLAQPRPAKLWRKVLAVMLIFFLGMGTGAVGSVALIMHLVFRHQAVPDWTKERVRDLDDRLKLTAEQKEKLQPVVLRAGERFQAIGNHTFEEIVAASHDVRLEIEKELTPEQKKKFDKLRPQMIAKLREWVQKQMVARQPAAEQPAKPAPMPENTNPAADGPSPSNVRSDGAAKPAGA